MSPFNGNFYDSSGSIRNIDGGGGNQVGFSPFNGDFYDSNGDIRNIDSLSGGGSVIYEKSIYDKVIRTQAEFVALYSSADWLGAKSVAFVGNGGTLEFTRVGAALKIPLTVKRIDGFNSAKIRIDNFTYGTTLNQGAIWYESIPASRDNKISGITLTVGVTGTTTLRGFVNFYNLLDCNVYFESTNAANASSAYGFYRCDKVTNGYVNGKTVGTGATAGFAECNNVINSEVLLNNTSTGISSGFLTCKVIDNPISMIYGTGAARAYSGCVQLTNPVGSAVGSTGYAYYNCSHINGSKEGDVLSTTGIWGGTWTFRDDQSCQIVRAAE